MQRADAIAGRARTWKAAWVIGRRSPGLHVGLKLNSRYCFLSLAQNAVASRRVSMYISPSSTCSLCKALPNTREPIAGPSTNPNTFRGCP